MAQQDQTPQQREQELARREAALAAREQQLYQMIYSSEGKDQIVIYVKNPRAVKRLGERLSVKATRELVRGLEEVFGRDNVRVTERKQ